jgi:hypothetical protein
VSSAQPLQSLSSWSQVSALGEVPPWSTVTLAGEQFFPSALAASWQWSVSGGPCDGLFLANLAQPSFTLSGANTRDATLKLPLSGDYKVQLTVVDLGGQSHSCTWTQHVAGPGLRVELCWDKQGPQPTGADLDLHVHRSGTITDWFGTGILGTANPDDCDYQTCKAGGSPVASWGYTNSSLAACSASPDGATWTSIVGACRNPRLEVDNINLVAVPEVTAVDDPVNNDSFRVAVHYYGGSVETHPMVNVYCGGARKATYGAAPDTLGPCPGTTCFNTGSGYAMGLFWRVADVRTVVDGGGNTTDCAVTALHPPVASGYFVTNNVFTY